MTLRAVLIGLIGATAICALTYLNDVVMQQPTLVGNHMPTSVYGGLIVFLVAVQPVLVLLHRKLALRGAELAVVLLLTLVACSIPASGLMRSLTTVMVAPYVFSDTEPGWREQGIVELTPRRMRAEVSSDPGAGALRRDIVVDGFLKGLPREDLTRRIAPGDIPWRAWARPLGFWAPLVLAVWMSVIGLSLVVHRQWSEHEHLPYPLARFTDALLPDESGSGGIWRDRLFWMGAVPVLVIHLNNYACTWFPDALIRIPTSFSLEFIFERYPLLWRPHYDGGVNAIQVLMDLRVFFAVVGFAYLLPRDVSLSLGLGAYLFMWVAAVLFSYGLWRGDAPFEPKVQNMTTAGAYLGVFAALVFTGRHYYSGVFRRALGLPARQPVDTSAVWGARAFLAGLALCVGALVSIGLEWPLAVLFAGGLAVIFVVMSRMLAETGMFFMMAWWSPGVLLLGFVGAEALGPRSILILHLLGAIFVVGYAAVPSREAVMPFVVNALKVLDLRGVRIGPAAVAGAAALALGFCVALCVTMYFQYDRGVLAAESYHVNTPHFAYAKVVRTQMGLEARGKLETSADGGWQRLARISPDPTAVAYFAAGLVLVLLFSFCRLRFPWWPLHPVLFLVWITHPGRVFASSFLVGWLLKTLVTKYGGIPIYRRLIPLMFGAIAGELLGGLVPVVISAVYYRITGELPVRFVILPP